MIIQHLSANGKILLKIQKKKLTKTVLTTQSEKIHFFAYLQLSVNMIRYTIFKSLHEEENFDIFPLKILNLINQFIMICFD